MLLAPNCIDFTRQEKGEHQTRCIQSHLKGFGSGSERTFFSPLKEDEEKEKECCF